LTPEPSVQGHEAVAKPEVIHRRSSGNLLPIRKARNLYGRERLSQYG